ncbi:hypothetical protein ACFVAE_00735 [Microbacterium sp. NPDC057659]|uniref:hypothetical protein n=1 Tax=Microbacterium sp. NPDC057659 TaxID=3346198 RepID=UPI0036722ED5
MDEFAPDAAEPGPLESPPPPAAEPAAPVRRRTWLWISGAVVLIGLVIAGVQLWANLAYDDADEAFLHARVAAAPPTATLIAALHGADTRTAAAQALDGVSTPELLGPENRAALAAAAEGLAKDRADAEHVGLALPGEPAKKPPVPWELFVQASDLRDRTTALEDRTADQVDAAQSLNDAIGGIDALGGSILDAAHAAVPTIEKASVDSRFAPIVEMRKADDEVESSDKRLDENATASLLRLDRAVVAVRASAKSELAAKAGPLYGTRRKIEAYARSISGGVLLEFVWTDRLLGQGAGQSGAGTATWDANDGGTSHITLTNSIARYWPAEWTRALVAHEVGHSISAKCYEKFDWENEHANELWATAWAMSWGYDPYPAGADNYGMPPKSMQEAAKTCR